MASRILLIDDSPVSLEVMAAHIEEWGYRVTTAASGAEGLVAFEAGDVDLVVSDLDLPDMTGVELFEKIHTRANAIPVILLSGETDTHAVLNAIHHGVSDFVSKFEHPTLLENAIQRALDRLWLARENRRLIDRLRGVNLELEKEVQERTSALEAANLKLRAEMEERQRREMEQRLGQKLEAVGQLASGIAHEINTPMQYIGDSIRFLRSGFDELMCAFEKLERACKDAGRSEAQRHLAIAAESAVEEGDVAFLQAEVPRAFERTLEGIERVTTIVRAMKEFAHPEQREKVLADLNQAVRNALTVARNEYKYVADVALELGELPPVRCGIGEINQVLLNLIVNAAHAIADVVHGTDARGQLKIRTYLEQECAVIEIGDSGGGIPESIRGRVFDPFFTTKPVGKGTGQGLAIARSIVVDKHGGSLEFETEVGRGTTFLMRLPAGSEPNGVERKPG